VKVDMKFPFQAKSSSKHQIASQVQLNHQKQ